jgi:pyruvate,water dikinase
VLKALAEKWRSELLPSYRRLVEEGMSRVDQASAEELLLLIDQVGRSAGEYLFSLAVVGGSAWKMEGCLAKFHRQHLAGKVEGSVQILLRGLPGAEPDLPRYAVQSVDWYRATAGELGWASVDPSGRDRQQRLIAERKKYETECRVALADAPKLRARFETLLEVTQRYAGIREEQARHFTLGWPLLRRSALRLGDMLRVTGAIDDPEDVFFLTHDELARRADSRQVVRQRRAEWERQRRLIAPLAIGKAPKLMEAGLSGAVEAVRTTSTVPDGAIVGEPASPGRASGRVRIVRGPEDFDRFEAGEVLVAQATAPLWTVLFARAAAVVTDGGTLAAHASLVAREYGIPAVVGTGDATARLRDGQVVTVDGGMGVVLTQS